MRPNLFEPTMFTAQKPSPPTARAPRLAVLDTQVVLDWMVFRDPSAARLADAIESGSLHWLTSQAMQHELEHVLDRGVAAAWMPQRAVIAQTCARLARRVDGLIPPVPLLHCSDPDDQKFIDLALASRAHWLFTRDRALLRLARKARERGVVVIRPADWDPSMLLVTQL